MTLRPDRRRFLLSSLGLALAFWVRPRGAGAAASLESRLVGILRDPGSAAAIGRAYLALEPDEADAARLARALARDVGLAEDGSDLRPYRVRRALAARTRQDFAEGRTVRVDGWVLARSELRLYALAALTAA